MTLIAAFDRTLHIGKFVYSEPSHPRGKDPTIRRHGYRGYGWRSELLSGHSPDLSNWYAIASNEGPRIIDTRWCDEDHVGRTAAQTKLGELTVSVNAVGADGALIRERDKDRCSRRAGNN